MERMFKCTKCGEFDNVDEWMNATIEDAKSYKKSGDNVVLLSEEVVKSKECLYYICPNCGETCYIEDEQIELVPNNTRTIKDLLEDEEVSYKDFRYHLMDKDLGNWDEINSTDTIQDYIIDQIKEGVHVSHILSEIETETSITGDWQIWLGNSQETPTPINSKEELVEALDLEEEDLLTEIE